jgi:hypothetical protein
MAPVKGPGACEKTGDPGGPRAAVGRIRRRDTPGVLGTHEYFPSLPPLARWHLSSRRQRVAENRQLSWIDCQATHNGSQKSKLVAKESHDDPAHRRTSRKDQH